jgi:hypothetical protein
MKYKNITTKDLYLANIGLVKAGAIIDTKKEINNSNFELVKNVVKPIVEIDNKNKLN